jgi:Peptidase family M28
LRSFDTEKALAWARALSFPRLVGKPDEVRARRWLTDELTALGLVPRNDEFRFFPVLSWGILKLLLVAGLVMLLAHRALLSTTPWLGALGGVAMPLVARTLWRRYRGAASEMLADHRTDHPILAAMIPAAGWQLRSGNIIADLPARGPIRRRVVLSAHTDSKSQNMSIVTRAICSVLFAVAVFLLPLFTLPGAIWPGWLTGVTGAFWWTFWLLGVFAAIVLLTLKVTDESPGALDNAGSVGLLVEIGRQLKNEPLDGVAVRLLFTGAEELGLAGAYRYVATLGEEPEWRDAIHLNFEAAGGGEKIWLATGSGPGKTESETAVKLAERACALAGAPARRLNRLVGAEADHIPLIEAGLTAVTFMFHGPKGTTIHTAADKPELLGSDSMALAGKITLESLGILEKEAKY